VSLTTIQPWRAEGPPLSTYIAVACASVLAAVLVVVLQWIALVVAGALAVIAIVAWRPRYGLYLVLLAMATFEVMQGDPVSNIGWFLESDVSSTTPISFLVITPIEGLLILTAISTIARFAVQRHSFHRVQLLGPLLIFASLMAVSIGWGAHFGSSKCVVAQGGPAIPTTFASPTRAVACNDNAPVAASAQSSVPPRPGIGVALWETRALFAAILVALLVPQLLRRREHVERIFDLLCLGVIALSIDVIVRRFTLLAGVPSGHLDLAYDHVSPVLMNFAVILLLARLIWPASGRQRLMALAIPLILYAEMLTERRAGWVGLDLGIALLGIFVFRLRQRAFYLFVLPLLFLYAGYLVTFWNAGGAVAQPARAVRSIVSPDPRDAASDQYRTIEDQDLRLNIQDSPLTGIGFGQPYVFYVALPSLAWWPFWHYEAHNSVLWLLMVMGPLGLIGFLSLTGASITRGVQLLRRAPHPTAIPILVALVSLVVMWLVFSSVDLGLINPRLTLWTGAAIGIIGTWGWLATGAEEAT